MTAILWRTAVRKGLLGGQRNWMTVFTIIAAVKIFRRLTGATSDVVYTGELPAGQALLITHHGDVRHEDVPQ